MKVFPIIMINVLGGTMRPEWASINVIENARIKEITDADAAEYFQEEKMKQCKVKGGNVKIN